MARWLVLSMGSGTVVSGRALGPAGSFRNLAALEDPGLRVAGGDDAAEAVVVGLGQSVPGELVDRARVGLHELLRQLLDAADDEQRGLDVRGDEGGQECRGAVAAGAEHDQIGAGGLDGGDRGGEVLRVEHVVGRLHALVRDEGAIAELLLETVAKGGAEDEVL